MIAPYTRAMRDADDVVDPLDRRVHAILARIAETTTDERHRELAQDLLLTLPPVQHWPAEAVRAALRRRRRSRQ